MCGTVRPSPGAFFPGRYQGVARPGGGAPDSNPVIVRTANDGDAAAAAMAGIADAVLMLGTAIGVGLNVQ